MRMRKRGSKQDACTTNQRLRHFGFANARVVTSAKTKDRNSAFARFFFFANLTRHSYSKQSGCHEELEELASSCGAVAARTGLIKRGARREIGDKERREKRSSAVAPKRSVSLHSLQQGREVASTCLRLVPHLGQNFFFGHAKDGRSRQRLLLKVDPEEGRGESGPRSSGFSFWRAEARQPAVRKSAIVRQENMWSSQVVSAHVA